MKKNKTIYLPLYAAAFFILALNCADNSGTLRDIEGNVYRTVKIGSQVWMAENLKVTYYRNGDAISNVKDDKVWRDIMLNETEAYCDYKNDEKFVKIYGRLYNWYAVNDQRGIAPAGWHIPTRDEWKQLVEYLEGGYIAGGKLKEKGTVHWNTPNQGATDKAGFAALPAGDRNNDGFFDNMGFSAGWWTATGSPDDYATSCGITCNSTEISPDIDSKAYGFSLRCIKD